MAQMPALRMTSALYPPQGTDYVRSLIDAVLIPREWVDGKPALRRALTANERAALNSRGNELAPWVKVGHERNRIADAVDAMMLGFGGRKKDGDEALVVTTQYVSALKDLPPWAVDRACARFARGEVQPAEIGQKIIDRNFGPTTAMLHVVAAALARPIQSEFGRIVDARRGVPKPAELSPEERAKVSENIDRMVGEFVSATSLANLDREAEDTRRQESMRARQREHVADLRQQYRDHGLEPPAGEVFTSLPMMLKAGYVIEERPGGRAALVAPVRDVLGKPCSS